MNGAVDPRAPVTEGVEGDIALIGMACRFPRADSPEDFWRLLVDGVEAIDTLTDDELRQAGVPSALNADPNYVRKASRLADIAGFDAEFFSMPPREAEILDPQHRLFLECAWEALERAGHAPDRPGQHIGVFAGCGPPGYFMSNLAANAELKRAVGDYALMLANDKDFLATRVAYKFGLTGPACTVQTACSTGLVAVHFACQSLLAGECGMALAGGVSLRVPQATGYLYQPGMILSPDGRCRPFDADAQGTIGGSGVGVVALRPLADALRDGDPIVAVIKGTAVNNDGADKVAYSAPSVSGQQAVIADALGMAGVNPAEIGYVEAHGTGTPLGDPIELRALAQAFAGAGERPRRLGSVKSNFGHLDAAAGVAGLIKAALVVRHGVVPPSLHFKRPNPEAGAAANLFHVPTRSEPWPSDLSPRRAGVSSFGIGGTNAHAVLEEAPTPSPGARAEPPYLFVLSARSPKALDQACVRLADHLDARPALDLADVAHTLAVGRASFRRRRFVVCRDAVEAADALRRPFNSFECRESPPPVAFMFPGQGSQRPGMGARLYAFAPVFRAEVDRCVEILRSEAPDLRALLLSQDAADINQTAHAQPALFVMGWALARQWIDWGVEPAAMIGHSLGELVAAAVAEVMSLDDALRLVALRGRLMQQAAPGAMLAVGLSETELRPLLPPALSLAAVNGPQACVAAGPAEVIEELAARLSRERVALSRLATSHAFHSAAMDGALARLREHLGALALAAPKIPFISCSSGDWISTRQATDPEYWARQARLTVRFSDGLATVLAGGGPALLELGPGQVLAGLARANHRGDAVLTALGATARRARDDDAAACLEALGSLWTAGIAPRWSTVMPGPRRRVELPTYPFQRRRFWIDAPDGQPKARPIPETRDPEPEPGAPSRRDPATWLRAISWRRLPPLRQSAPQGRLLVFADGSPLSEAVLARAGDAIVVRPAPEALQGGEIGIDPADERDWRRLIERLDASGQFPATILYLWSLAGDENSCFHFLVQLARALEGRGRRDPLSILIATCGAQDVLGDETISPTAALAVGPARVIRCETPWIASRCVDVAPACAEAAPLLLAEAAAPDGEILVAHRGASRWAPESQPAQFARTTAPPLRERGAYMILGGLGGIGLSLAHDLARYCSARVALVSRSGLPPRSSWPEFARGDSALARRLRRVIAIEEDGGEVLALAADATDPVAMRAAMAEAESRFDALNGFVHAAGLPGTAMIARTDLDSARAVLAAKSDGMRALAPLLTERRLDFVALCSSTAGLFGEPGQVAYCAANAALDAWAHHLRRLKTPAVSIDWGVWREVGMAVETETPADLRAWRAATLAQGITPREGGEAFRLALAAGLSQIIIAPAPSELGASDPAARSETAATPGLGADAARLAAPGERVPRPELACAYAAPDDAVQSALAAMWEELLGIAPIGVDDDFFALGGHSLLATRVLAGVWRDFEIEMSLADFFQHSTIATLADQILLRRNAAGDS